MRRVWHSVVLWGVLGLAILPGPVFAQGFHRPLGPWDFLATVGMSAYTGYFGHRNGVQLSFSSSDQAGNSVDRLRQQYPLEGISTQLIMPVRITGPLGVVVGGGYSACFSSVGEETVQQVGRATVTRNWKVVPQAANLQLAATVDIFPSLMGMLGFRYENFQTSFVNPNAANSAQLSASDTANIAYNGYLPCLGLIACAPAIIPGLNLQLGFIGCPVLLGSVDYRESWYGVPTLQIGGTGVAGFMGSNSISSGGYFDAFAEVSLLTWCGVQVGGYGKYEYMTASTGVKVGQGDPLIPTTLYDFSFQRRLWGVGGRVSVTF